MDIENPNFLFHGSTVNSLQYLLPNKSTHGEKYVYATDNPIFAVLFSSNTLGDFGCSVGLDNCGKPFVCERFRGAFYHCYSINNVSIYIVSKKTFFHKEGLFSNEFVSLQSVPILEEIRIENAVVFLDVLRLNNELVVYEYPERPSMIPMDDSDLQILRLLKLKI